MKLNTLKFSVFALFVFAFSFSTVAQEKKEPNHKKRFERWDSNGDDAVTLEEFKSVKRRNEVSIERLEKQFARMDKDSNGTVTLKEVIASYKEASERRKKKNN